MPDCQSTRLYANDPLPTVSDFDWLIVIGEPMNIYEEEQYPWLIAEKQLIKQAIEEDKIVLGICLGAQLIADTIEHNVAEMDKAIAKNALSWASMFFDGERFELI